MMRTVGLMSWRRSTPRCEFTALRPATLAVGVCLALNACALPADDKARRPWTPGQEASPSAGAAVRGHSSSGPRIIEVSRPLQCVPYARELSAIQIRGDAWTWWGSAEGRFERGTQPRVGAVLVLRRKGRSRGHLAVVTRIVDDREIIVNHANWLNRGRIHLDTPVRDVSPRNDWSAVRFWYTPANVLGKSTYPAYGFIYPPLKTVDRAEPSYSPQQATMKSAMASASPASKTGN